jgi:hypothetical protein
MVDTCDARERNLELRCPGCNYKLVQGGKSRINRCRELLCPGCGHVFTENDVDDSNGPEE